MDNAASNFSGALSTWKDINLTELQKQLDAQGIELVENQKESVVSRKSLADKTKEFKKIPDEEKANAFKSLLKAYQIEIDNLTKRCKTSENAFLGVYKLLADAPDPYPFLEAAVDQTVKVAEAEELQKELSVVQAETAELKRQIGGLSTMEANVRKAEARAEVLEEKMDTLVQEKVRQKENELNATYDEKLMNYEEREKDLHRQLSLTQQQLRDLRISNETNQAKLLNQSERQDQEVVARLAEIDMIVADLERANARVAAVERRNELLRAEIESVRSGSESEAKIKSLETDLADMEQETSRLLRTLDDQKTAFSAKELALRKRIDDGLREVAVKEGDNESLRARLRHFSDYDEIKRELEIMKYVEFGGAGYGEDDDETVKLPDPNAQKANIQPAKSLEALVLAKNKRILDELAKLRIARTDLEMALETTKAGLEYNITELQKQRDLNERLENDLLQLNTHVSPPNGSARSPSPATTTVTEVTRTVLDDLMLAPSLSSEDKTPFSSSADKSILPIVTNQRDRFRQRNAELEEELKRQFEVITDLRNDIKNLQQDNLKLYEKVRYMQTYRDDSAGGPSSFVPGPQNGIQIRPDEMNKYKNMYEERINPFEAFRGREAARAEQALDPIERAVFLVTRTILGNRRARMAFAAYAGALHLLVLITLYECSSFASGGGTTKVNPPPFG
ncbi:CASP C terminal-domain-containing protein [Cantharellus anzutake]|uniref:CASP C terminal-domain-containing protein n=1 Tax=Cantharellus anzutake TaxID=1750568 RepID=UPI001907D692|nr:CASP C terminal-domain-containing protein [Cantharellus anzutake]KAF8331111.1 CASP C terminal-domain-containing protein [Cantharellus anzutake]